MDEKFLEFWGNLLLNAARSKKQTDDLNEWMRKGVEQFHEMTRFQSDRGFEDMWTMFRKFYDLDQVPERSSDYQSMVQKTSEDFQKSFADYLSMMGMVSKKEHLALVEKYERLKAKAADQEETIRHLQMLLENVKREDQGDAVKNLQKIVKDQTDLFQKMMLDFPQGFAKESNDLVEQKGETKKNDEPRRPVETDE